MSTEHVSATIEKMVQSSSMIQEFAELETDVWAVQVDATDVTMTYEPEMEVLTLHAVLGVPSETHRRDIYQTLLAINGQSRRVRGIRFALEPEEGVIVQECPLRSNELTAERLEELLRYFGERAVRGSKLVSGEITPTHDVPSQPLGQTLV